MPTLAAPDLRPLADALSGPGFLHLPAPGLQALLGWTAQQWAAFAATWEELGTDGYMADGGRYRRRRHAAFGVQGDKAHRTPPQPHFQSRAYNPLNGGVQRWFDPMEPGAAASPILDGMFTILSPLFATLDGHDTADWHSEVHQFRIETSPTQIGRPTPEGFHRDGVDWVLVMLIGRRDVAEGTTEIVDLQGNPLGRFTLSEPGDAVLLNDRRILHGVTPVQPLGNLAFRDALVVTWQAEEGLQSAR